MRLLCGMVDKTSPRAGRTNSSSYLQWEILPITMIWPSCISQVKGEINWIMIGPSYRSSEVQLGFEHMVAEKGIH